MTADEWVRLWPRPEFYLARDYADLLQSALETLGDDEVHSAAMLGVAKAYVRYEDRGHTLGSFALIFMVREIRRCLQIHRSRKRGGGKGHCSYMDSHEGRRPLVQIEAVLDVASIEKRVDPRDMQLLRQRTETTLAAMAEEAGVTVQAVAQRVTKARERILRRLR